MADSPVDGSVTAEVNTPAVNSESGQVPPVAFTTSANAIAGPSTSTSTNVAGPSTTTSTNMSLVSHNGVSPHSISSLFRNDPYLQLSDDLTETAYDLWG